MADNPFMTAPWTCPFCPLLCDHAGVAPVGTRLSLLGSDCARAQMALARFAAAPSAAQPQIGGRAVGLQKALVAAAEHLAASRQPLFGGLGTDVAGARALYRLACETGAICDAASGPALMHGLRSLQDRGAFSTTLAEVRARADLIVCVTGLPTARYPEWLRRCGVGEPTPQGEPLPRHLVVLGVAPGDAQGGLPNALPNALSSGPADQRADGLAGITSEALPRHGDLFTTVSVLAALVAGRAMRGAPPALAALAARLLAARYAVIVWDGAALPAHGALVVEVLNAIVGTLNRSTRAATLPLGGGDGAATVNQVFSWLGGLPLRSRLGPLGLEHEPLQFDAARLLADRAVDALLWVASFGTEPAAPTARLPRIVLGHPDAAPASPDADTVFIPVSTPGIGSAGHLFRTDGVVLMPLNAVVQDTLPTVADVVGRLTLAVQSLRQQQRVTA